MELVGRALRKPKILVCSDVAHIYLSGARGGVAKIDASDLPLLEKYGSWRQTTLGYACASTGRRGDKIYLHRLIADCGPQVTVDFLDGDKLNCWRANLATVPNFRTANTNRGGVHFVSERGKWRAHPSVKGKRLNLGYFDTEEEAIAAVKLHVPKNPDRGIFWDKSTNKYRAYSKDVSIGTFATIGEARRYRDLYEAGDWVPPKKTPGIYFDAQFEKYRASDPDTKTYLGRFATLEQALAAQAAFKATGSKQTKFSKK